MVMTAVAVGMDFAMVSLLGMMVGILAAVVVGRLGFQVRTMVSVVGSFLNYLVVAVVEIGMVTVVGTVMVPKFCFKMKSFVC